VTDPDAIYLAEWDAERDAHTLDDGTFLDPSEEFWTARPELEHLLTFARAKRAGPWAVLGVTLARVVAQTPPWVVLPGRGSLNLYVGMVGRSGGGKGRATRTAEDAIDFPTQEFTMAGLGSGEGLAHLYARRVRDKNISTVQMHTTAVLLDVAEVDTIAALGSRNSATILPELRKGWSGERLGFSYADPDKRLPIAAHSYRLCLTAGIQPKRAGALLDDSDGGTPQRFVWLPVSDPYAPDVPAETPAPWTWKVPPAAEDHGWKVNRDAASDGEQASWIVLDVCPTAQRQVDAFDLANVRGELDIAEVDTHAMLSQLKIGAALGLLNGHLGITEEDWGLAELVKAQSDRQRASVQRAIALVAEARNKAQGVMEGKRAVIASEIAEERALKRVTINLLRYLRNADPAVNDGWIGGSRLRSMAMSGKDRPLFERAMGDLLATRDVVVEEVEGGLRYHRT
jgi:hypothetical protein